MRTGRTVSVPGRYEAVSIKDGVAELVRYRQTDVWLMPVTGGGEPVRFAGKFIMFSELAPDGRTVAAFEWPEYREGRLALLDTRTGRVLRKVTIRGLPEGRHGAVSGTSVWRSGSVLTITYTGPAFSGTLAVDVNTGQARRLTHLPGTAAKNVILPGTAGIG
ncbi:hypothetical protein Misp01_48570 [Microtetraspora sp. NBRC 13810]|uniref:hypothetical protein n=1 Tax=Microtetraspora sp. NBRC 13810 TaxID=3030990 RepID=UPI0024A0606E|nr:hypothetical protein [Microtetraspora sp. NBRC 13810]GLW09728.1 hypothetical protein Misp01_48570 [Microtetraspora sp. NBRC 13810]